VKFLPLIFAIALLAGCETYHPQPLSPDKTAAQYESRTLDGDGLRAFVKTNLAREFSEWPPQHWNLELLTLAAYYYQPGLDVSRAQWRSAEAAAISAGARPNPTVSVAPGFTANSPAGVPQTLFQAGFDWPVETAGKRKLRVAQAKQLVAAARFNLITTAWQVRANVRDGLAAYRFAENKSGTLGQSVAAQKEIVVKLEGRLKAGEISPGEVTPARVALGKMEADFAAARNDESAVVASVANAIGISVRVFTNLPLEMTLYTPMLSDEQISGARIRALHNRADLLAALAQYAAAESALHLEIAKQYPDIRLSPGYEYDQGANKWRIGLSFDLPVLNHNQGPIGEAKAKRDELAANFLALQARVISEIDTATGNFRRVRQNAFDFLPAIDAAAKQEHSVEAQVSAGAADNLDLLNARLERLAAVAVFDDTGHRSEVAFGQLEDAMQQLLEQRAEVIAPAPPTNLEINPREEKSKP
jgi:outer membrane protein TolC